MVRNMEERMETPPVCGCSIAAANVSAAAMNQQEGIVAVWK